MKGNVLTRGLTSGATYNASALDYYNNLLRQYELAKRQLEKYERQRREYERELKDSEERRAKEERDRKAQLEKLKKQTSAEERELAAVRALEKWGKGETPSQRDADLFEISDYKNAIATGSNDAWYDKAWRKIKDFFLSADGITATGWKTNDIQASQFSGNLATSREDLQLLKMAEDYYKGNRTPLNVKAIQELNRRKPGFLNSAAVYANKALDWIGNNSVTGTTGAFLGTDELDKVRIGIDFDENTSSEQALLNIEALRNSYKAFDELSYNAYIENRNKAKYYENMLNSEYKRKLNVAEGRIADENGVVDGSVDFFNFSKLAYQLPGIIAGSISSPSQLISSFATGALTAGRILAATTAATAATVGTGGWGAVAVPSILAAAGAAATFGLNQAQGAHENAAEVDEGYISKVRYALDQHPAAAADFYKKGRSILGKDATEEEIITAKLANKIPSSNKIIDKAFDDAAIGSQRLYDRDMVATTGDSTIDTALQITPLKFFSVLGKSAIKANLRSSRIARAADKAIDKLGKLKVLDGGDEGVLRKSFGKYGALVSGEAAAVGAAAGTVLDNTLGRIPKVNTAIKAMTQFDIAKIKRLGPKTSNWLNYAGSIVGRGLKSAISEGIEEGKQYYNQQRAVEEFQKGLANGNLSYDTQTILGDVLDDFLAGRFAAAGLVQAITGKPLLDYLHYTDENIINAAEAIKNIKSGMVGGHGQTTLMTAATGYMQTKGTHGDIDDMELAIRALEQNKLAAQKQFAVDQILSRTNQKYIANAIDYLKNSNSIKLTDKELEDLQRRATEVKGISDSPIMKSRAKDLGISNEDYHKFVADYMYHKDNLEAEREDLQGAEKDLNDKANEIKVESEKIINPSDEVTEQWSKNDLLNEKDVFEKNKASQISRLETQLKTLNDRLEKEALTNSQKKEVLTLISSVEEALEKTKESAFDDSKKKSYAESRFDRINTIARMRGIVKQLKFLNDMLSLIPESNTAGKEFIQKEVDATKKLLNDVVKGNMLRGKLLTADNIEGIDEFIKAIATQIERGDQDNEYLMGASAELTAQIESLAQAYQERSKATLNYNIAKLLFNDFLGYDTKDGKIVPEGTEGAKHVKGNAKEHLEGILSAQDDDAKLEQAYQQGFADYGFSGVYKNESPLVKDEEAAEEEAKPGTIERRNRIKELGSKIREFSAKAKNYVSGKWKSFGHKKVFVADKPDERGGLDPSENQLDVLEYYNSIVADYEAADDAEKWLNSPAIDTDNDAIKSNAHLLTSAWINLHPPVEGVVFVYGDMNNPNVDVYYNDVKIGSLHPIIFTDIAEGDDNNYIDVISVDVDELKWDDISYLEGLVKEATNPEAAATVTPEEGAGSTESPKAATPVNTTDAQDVKMQVLNDLSEKMKNKFDASLRTSSHYFEWINTAEGKKLKLWHRLHDEIGSNFKESKTNKQNWSQLIKSLYSVVYHKGYSNTDREGIKDIQALIDHLQNFYKTDQMNELLFDRIEGYILYLKQEKDDISDADLYECIKGISEEIGQEVKSNTANLILDRGSAADEICRTVFGTNFTTKEKAIEYCKTLEIQDKQGNKKLAKDYFTNEAFEQFIEHLLDVKRVYVEELGYVLWTSPFTIYTEDFEGANGHINIAGEVDMIAIDRDGNPIIIDYKTSKNPFFFNGKESSLFSTPAENLNKSAKEQYTNQQSAYVLMLNETTRKETTVPGGFDCNQIRLFPMQLKTDRSGKLIEKVTIEFSKDQQLILLIIPFEELGNNVIFKTEDYRSKLAQLSAMYAKVEYIATHLNIYYRNDGETELAKDIRNIKESLDSILLCLKEVTSEDLALYNEKISNAIMSMETSYFGNKDIIDEVCRKYNNGELQLAEEDAAYCHNNLNWDNPLNENDIDKFGGFEAMGVKDRKEYDEKVDELAHVACEADFLKTATAKLTAIEYQTRRGNDKIAVYASITYKDTTYPPIRIYLSRTNGEEFAKDVLAGKTVGVNINTTVGLLSKCSDGNLHLIGDNKQLVEAIGGTEENPYEHFAVDIDSNENVAIATFNESTGQLTTISRAGETKVALPKTLKSSTANGHIIINVVPEVSGSGNPIPIVCNTKQINETTGIDLANHKTQSLLDFLVEVVLQGINEVEHSVPLKEKITINDEQIPLTYGQILNFFFEPYDSNNSSYIQRPQYTIISTPTGRAIKIGNFSRNAKNPARVIGLDDTKALRDAISKLSIWVSVEMAGVRWSSGKPGSKQFNEFADFLRNLEDGLRFYLGNTGVYFDKSDADGTFLGFLAKNGLLTTPFNGFSHPLISIGSCIKEGDVIPSVIRNDEPDDGEEDKGPKTPLPEDNQEDEEDEYAIYRKMYETDDDIDSSQPIFEGEEDPLDAFERKSKAARRRDNVNPASPVFNKLQEGRSSLDETAARQYLEKVLGKDFVDKNLDFVDEISSAIVGGLSAGTIIAGQVTANMMKLSHYAENGTEYHEAFHWAFELIIDPTSAKAIRKLVRKKYGITDQREIAEWLADTYMYYVRNIYVPKGTLLLKAFAKIRLWGITFKHIFTGEYQIYKVFNDINSGKYANKPINNKAVLRFQKKLKELNLTIPTVGYEKDGIQYKYLQGPIDHEQNIRQIAFFALNRASVSPAASYVTNSTVTVNVKSILDRNLVKKTMMLDHRNDEGKYVKGIPTEKIIKDRQNPKNRSSWNAMDNALALRELLDDEHIDKTQEYVSAYIDRLIGVKGKDLSTHGSDDSSAEANMDESYARTEDGDVSFAGSPKEHIVPDHQISRMSKTSSRVKLFFATIPNFSPNEFGKFGYYNLRDIYLTVLNRYYWVMSPEELWKAIENDSVSNPMIESLNDQISAVRKLLNNKDSRYRENAIGLLNEIYRSIKSTKLSHEVTKTRRDRDTSWITYRSTNIMVQNNSFAISREFTETVLGGFNKFYMTDTIKDGKKEIRCVMVRDKIRDEASDQFLTKRYRETAYEDFFGSGYNSFTDTVDGKKVKKAVHSIYNVLISYGTKNQKPLYVRGGKNGYTEVSIEKNLNYIKFKFIEALSSLGIDITQELLDDVLETQFGGIGIMQMKQLLTQTFVLPAKGNTHKEGSRVTIWDAADTLYSKILSELDEGNGVIRSSRLATYRGQIKVVDGTDVFRNQKLHTLLSVLIATAQQKKYEVSARGVDGKLTYAMADDNTVTAMCDVVFNKTKDPLCTKIRQMITNDPFNMSMGNGSFEGMAVGSYILPRINDEGADYEIVNDAGIETGNNENSSTNSEKRGADTIMSIITRLCLNMIVLAPFADKSTALSIRLRGIKIPGINYDAIVYQFKQNENKDELTDEFKSYIMSTTVTDNGRVILSNKNREIDETIAQYVLAEYYQAKEAILDYKDILRNHSTDNKTQVEEAYKTAFNICKKLIFMSQFSGDYVQNEKGELVFKPFSVEKGSNKTDIEAAEAMISQFESIVYDRDSLLLFVNRHVNGLMLHELQKLKQYGIVKKKDPNEYIENPRLKNVLLDKNILQYIYSALNKKYFLLTKEDEEVDNELLNELAILIFMYDIVGKSIISKLESERLFTGQSDLYDIRRDAETRIITVPYLDLAKRIGSFASTGSVGVIEKEDYVCAEIQDDIQPIEDQVRRSIYMNEIDYGIKTGTINMSEHPDFDFRHATIDDLKNLIPNGYHPIVDKKIEAALRGFNLENKNNVTDGVSFISAEFAKRLLKLQGAWNYRIARAFKILTSDDKLTVNDILNSYETFNKVFTQVIGTLKYTAVGFRTEWVNGQKRVVQYVNKTALFPVFACLCNEKMDAIRRQMESLKVDMLMFESAVKVGAHGNSTFTVDNDGNVAGQFNTYSQKSFFLRKQLNTDPNEKEKMKIGIQTVKVALSAAIGEKDLEWNGELQDGDVIIEQIMEDINKLTEKRSEKLMSKLNTQEDVVEYVTRFLRGNSVPEQIIEAFQSGIPAEALSILKHIDTLSAKRILEDVVRIDSPGSAFIQRCVYGVEGPNVKFGNLELNDGEELRVINSDGSMDCVLSADYFVEYKGAMVNGKWMEGVPHFKLTPGKHKKKLTIRDKNTGEERPMSFEEIRDWLKKNNIIGKNAKAAILSYRIPTQAVASINALKCVDVIPVVRDTVVLPKLFTTITGADFDIDKLFISTVWYSMEEQEDGSYKPQQIDDTETEEGMANVVVNDYINILCATAKKKPEVFYRSIDEDTNLANNVISFIKKLYPPTEQDMLDNASGVLQSMPSMLAKVHDEFLAGKFGIGPFALALVNHVLTRIYKVGFNSDGIYLRNKKLSTDVDDDGNSIMSWLSAMINKHVDVAKNPDITYLNVNDSTFNVVALLLRLGYGRRTFMFTCQEIMKDYAFTINQESAVCKYTKNDNGYFDARQQAFDEMVSKYKLNTIKNKLSKCSLEDIYKAACQKIFDVDVVPGKSLCLYVLENHGEVPEGVKIKIGLEDFKLTKELFQYLNLLLFNYLSDRMARPLTKLQQASVIDNERCITSMILSSFYKQAVEDVRLDKTLYNVDKLLSDSYIDTKIQKTIEGTDAIYDGCSCMDKDVVTAVAKEIDPNILTYGKDRMNTFLSTVRDGMVAYYGAKFFDKYCKDNNIDRLKLFKTGKNGIVRRLAEIQASARSNRGNYKSLRNNLLIKGLSIESIIGELYRENVDAVFYNDHRFMDYEFLRFKYAGQSDDNIIADVLQAWDQLLNYPDKKIQDFARDLIVYSFYTSGEMPGMTKLFKYVPPSWRVNSGYGEHFKQIRDNKASLVDDIDDIIDKLCRNLWYKDKFVRKVGKYKLAKFKGSDVLKEHSITITLGSGEIGETDSRTEPDPIFSPVIAGILYIGEDQAEAIFTGGKDKCPRYIKCVDDHHDLLTNLDDSASAWTLYKLVGFNTYTDKSGKSWPYPVYVQTSVLGEKYYRNNIFEYNEELEPNQNLDAYGITNEFISKLGEKAQTGEDIQKAIENIMVLLTIVNAGVNNAFEGRETEAAMQAIDILVNRETGESTFEPLRTIDKSADDNAKALTIQAKKTCNR